jgi:hypothetical protein
MDSLHPTEYGQGYYALDDDLKMLRLGQRQQELKEEAVERKLKIKLEEERQRKR